MQVEGQIHGKRNGGFTLPTLAIALLGFAGLFLAIVGVTAGPSAFAAAFVAVALCATGVIAGFFASKFVPSEQPLARLAIAMMNRMFVPLFGLLVFFKTAPALISAGLAYYTIAIYLSMLTAETYLAIRQLESSNRAEGAG